MYKCFNRLQAVKSLYKDYLTNLANATDKPIHPTFPIVGIGASAGGLEAFSALLKALPTDTGMSFVIIQHLDATHVSYLREALIKATKMPILDIIHGLMLQPNHVYVLPSNVDLEITASELKIIPRVIKGAYLHMPINTFLISLANNCKRRAIGVILSGNGNDGTEGLRAIKNAGGFTFAQDPTTAKYSSMPESALLAGLVDFSLPVEKLAEELAVLAHHSYYDEEELEVTKEYLQSLNDQHQKTNDALATANEEFVYVNKELQRSNQELGQVNNDLINLLNSVQIPIVILDEKRRIRRFTPHARSIMNLLPTDIGRSVDDIRLNLVISNLDAQINEAVQKDEVKESEVQDRDGRWFRIQIRPYKTMDNKVEGTVISLFDINVLKRDVDIAEWARDYATGIVEGVQIPLVVLDKNIKVMSANKAFYNLFKVSKSETENSLLFDLGINQWDIPVLRATLGEMLNTKSSFQNAEVEREFPDIGKRTMSLSAQSICFDAEVSDMILLSIEDVTFRKEQKLEKANLLRAAIMAKKEAEEASKQLRLIADSVPIHLVHLDRDEKFLFINKAGAKMWMRSRDEMVGKTIAEITGTETQKNLMQYTQEVLSGKTVSYESPFVTPEGKNLTFLVTYSPDFDEMGNVSGFVSAGTDITLRKQMENELRESLQKLAQERGIRERFVSAISHDLRTPLSVARLGAEMILRKSSNPTQLHKIAEKIIKNMDRADGMIRDLLDANRLKAGEKLHLSIQKSDLMAVVEEVLVDLKSLHGKRFNFQCKETISGYWDCEAIRRMIENLASNGIKYGIESGEITIHLEQKNTSIELSVSNKGTAISPEDQKNIFELFRRSETAARGSYEGWGIGLTLVRGLARAHGGDVHLSSSEAEGTCFKIILPVDARKFAN